MKKAFLLFVSLASLSVFASETGTVVSCSNVASAGKTEVKVVQTGNRGLRLVVRFEGRQVFDKSVARQKLSDRTYFVSGTFTNANGAPATLTLQTYKSGSRLLGEFSEVSYVPVTRGGHGLICR